MDRRRSAVMVSLVLLVSIMLATHATATEQFHGQMTRGHGQMTPGHPPPAVWPPIVPHGFFGNPNFGSPHFPRASVSRPVAPHHFPPHAFPSRGFHSRSFAHHRFIPFGLSAGSVVFYAPSYIPTPDYAPTPGGYSYPDDRSYYGASMTGPASMTSSVMTAPTEMPSVVEFSTGRYELRGDGLTMPYKWVWIPNPPSAPPASPGGASFSAPPSAARRDKLYRWTDTQGVLHVTDRWEAVPPEYRAQAKSPEPS